MLELEAILNNIKKIENFKNDKDVANILNMKNDSLSKYKKRNSIPYKNIIEYALTKNISIDELFGLHNNDLMNKFIIKEHTLEFSFYNLNEKICIPERFLNFEYSKSINAFSDNHKTIYLINTQIKKFEGNGKYLLNYDNNLYIALLKIDFKKNINIEIEKINLKETVSNNLNDFHIVGKVLLNIDINKII